MIPSVKIKGKRESYLTRTQHGVADFQRDAVGGLKEAKGAMKGAITDISTKLSHNFNNNINKSTNKHRQNIPCSIDVVISRLEFTPLIQEEGLWKKREGKRGRVKKVVGETVGKTVGKTMGKTMGKTVGKTVGKMGRGGIKKNPKRSGTRSRTPNREEGR
ncbi:hypothetical protein TrRE_jg6551, partial [Triparma retinervis]